MKRLIFATFFTCLTGISTTTLSQSNSVTFYGIIDNGYGTINNVGTAKAKVTGMQNGGLQTSRLGLRGNEDLGNGLKAIFNLEAEILTDNGGQQSTSDALFARASWVGLASKNLGELRLGRMNTLGFGTVGAFDPMGANNFGSVYTSDFGFARVNNAVEYSTPTYAGLRLIGQTGTATPTTSTGAVDDVASNMNGNRINGLSLNYNQGKFSASAIHEQKFTSAGVRGWINTTLVASYQFDIAKVSAGIINANTGSTGVTVSKYFAGAQIPVTKNIRINTVYQQVKNQVNGYTPKSQSVMAVYDFSKRTAMYAGMAMSQQDGNSTLPIVSSSKWSYTDSTGTRVAGASPAAGQNQTAYMVGVRHAF